MDDSDDDDQQMQEDEDSDDNEVVDIRALVGKGRKTGPEPPAKKQRKA